MKDLTKFQAQELLQSWLNKATVIPSKDEVIKLFKYRKDGEYVIEQYSFRYLLSIAYDLKPKKTKL